MRRLIRGSFFVILVVLAARAASAQEGTISGTVTLFEGALEYRPSIQIYDTNGFLVQTAVLGPGGWTGGPRPSSADTIPWSAMVMPGTYYVRTLNEVQPGASVNGWVDQLYGAGVCVAADCNPLNGTAVTVMAGQTTSGINFTLDTGASITGAGLSTRYDIYDSRGVQLPNRIAFSGSGSGYIATGLPAGTYYVLAHQQDGQAPETLYESFPCDGCAVTSGTPITVAADENKTGMDFGTPSSGTIAGTVGGPATDGVITVYALNGAVVGGFSTFSTATFSIGTIAPGTYYVGYGPVLGYSQVVYPNIVCAGCNPTIGAPVTVTANATTLGVDFDLSLAQGTSVSGNDSEVISNGPLSTPTFGTVIFYTSSPAQPAARVAIPFVGFNFGSGFNNGSYSVTLPQGSYYAQTNPLAGSVQQIYPGIACPQGNCPTRLATPIVVGATAVTDIAFNPPTCTASTIAPVSLANAALGAPYRQTLLATGANGAVGWTVSSGILPPGLALDPNSGVLSGTPTTSGHFTFTVAAVDSIGCAGTRAYSLDVPPCVVAVIDSPVAIARGGGIDLEFTSTCASLTASTTASWITVNPVSQLPLQDDGTRPFVEAWLAAANSGPARQGTIALGSHAVTVTQQGAGADLPAFGSVDLPADGAVVSGSIAISGWALDDLRLDAVEVYRDPVAGETGTAYNNLVFIGNATLVSGARPDVAALYPTYPDNTRAGWGYLLLTNVLPNQGNGTFRIWAYGVDQAFTRRGLLGTKVISAVNSSATAPFGAIDTPAQGATISGTAVVNFGWALTPQPKMIPIDGSTIQVVIDGVPVGNATAYNLFRSDVSTLFPGLKNSAGPVGYRVIDTTALSDGLHTIAWIATDDHGAATGIGSRFFTVQNSAWQSSLRANFAVTPPAVADSELAHADATTTIPARVDGVHIGRKAESLASLPRRFASPRTATISNLQNLKLSLDASEGQAYDGDGVGQGGSSDSCAATYAGYLVVNGKLAALPVGSSLDPGGTFYWHPGSAFFGTYQLVFARTSCDGVQQRIPVTITIR